MCCLDCATEDSKPWRFEDSVVFRAEYEERYRAAWDLGQDGPSKALILHLRGTHVDDLPWDYLNRARRVSVSLANLFRILATRL